MSQDGDWSQVKVWYDPLRDLGGSVYHTYGFIYQDQRATTLANAQSTARQIGDGVGAAMTRVASAVNGAALTSAANEGVDRIAALLQGGGESEANGTN